MLIYCAYFDENSKFFTKDDNYNELFAGYQILRFEKELLLKRKRPLFLYEVLEALDIPYNFEEIKHLKWEEGEHDIARYFSEIRDKQAHIVFYFKEEE